MEELKKRTWHYIQNPKKYGIQCDKCNGTNIEWSEWEGLIWCYDCQIDSKGFEGIFGSPIGVGMSKLLGIRFERWNMIEQRVEYPRLIGNKIEYFPEPPQNPEEGL